MNNKYIYTINNSISKELCYEIINMFENDDSKIEGLTLGGLNKNIKDTTDLVITLNNKKWYKIYNFLYNELSRKLSNYFIKINNNTFNYIYFETNKLYFEIFMIQRYLKNEGKYIYHHDFRTDLPNKKHRILTYLWYLNDVEEGGETVLEDNIFIKPEAGKLLIFPACWTYPHTGKVPLSSNKYIITGWVYIDS